METRRGSVRARTAAFAGLALSSLYGGCTPEPTLTPEHTRVHTIQIDGSQLPPLPLLDTFTEFDNATSPLLKTPDTTVQEQIQLTIPLIKIESATRTFSCSGSPISPTMIATAAHCLSDIPPTQLRLSILDTLGRWNFINGAFVLENTDVALLQTEQTLNSSSLHIRPTTDVKIGEPLFIHAIKPNQQGIDTQLIQGRYIGRAINIETELSDQQLEDYFLVIVDPGVLETGFSGAGISDDNGNLVGILNAIGPITLNHQDFFAGLATRSEHIQQALERSGN